MRKGRPSSTPPQLKDRFTLNPSSQNETPTNEGATSSMRAEQSPPKQGMAHGGLRAPKLPPSQQPTEAPQRGSQNFVQAQRPAQSAQPRPQPRLQQSEYYESGAGFNVNTAQSRAYQEPEVESLSYEDEDPRDRATWDQPQRTSPLHVALAIAILIAITVSGWFAYQWLVNPAPQKVPLITAPIGSYKIKPEDPGGIVFPHQDKLVYGRISSHVSKVEERVLPPSEQPTSLPKPQRHALPNYPVEIEEKATLPQQPGVASVLPQAQRSVPKAPPAGKAPSRPSFQQDLDKLISREVGGKSARNKPVKPKGDYLPLPSKIPANSPMRAAVLPTQKKSQLLAKPTPAPKVEKTFRLQIATVESAQEAKQESRRLLRNYKGVLKAKNLMVEAVPTNSGNIVYRLVYGKYTDYSAAQKAAKKLKGIGVDSFIFNATKSR